MVRKRSSSKARVILTAEATNLTAAEQRAIRKNCQEISTNNLAEPFSFFRQAKGALPLQIFICREAQVSMELTRGKEPEKHLNR